eukprot:m51a1_g12746 hypothetical protein (342) ;mRNA; f:61-1445
MSTLRNGCRLSAPVSAAVELVEPPPPPQPESSELNDSSSESSNASPPTPQPSSRSSRSSLSCDGVAMSSSGHWGSASSSSSCPAFTATGDWPEVAAIFAPVSVVGILLLVVTSVVVLALRRKELARFERSFRQYYQMHHEDYTATRIRQGKLPLVFVVTAAWEVRNSVLEAWYEARRRYMEDTLRRTEEELEERVAFHGTMERNVGPICDHGLLRVGHPLNPSHSTDTGFFGDPHCGVYASRFVEYTLQYSNVKTAYDGTECLCPLNEGDNVKVVMLKALPGKTLHMKSVAVAVPPTAGYDSHSSPQWAEWFFFDETQLCPTHVVEVLAITNRRTEANEGL